jgi:hypothetical protein
VILAVKAIQMHLATLHNKYIHFCNSCNSSALRALNDAWDKISLAKIVNLENLMQSI